MATDKLPPLPEPAHTTVVKRGLYGHPVGLFTAEQMRAYGQASRQQALEEAAKLADAEFDPEWPGDDLSEQAQRIASAIRGLDGQEQESRHG